MRVGIAALAVATFHTWPVSAQEADRASAVTDADKMECAAAALAEKWKNEPSLRPSKAVFAERRLSRPFDDLGKPSVSELIANGMTITHVSLVSETGDAPPIVEFLLVDNVETPHRGNFCYLEMDGATGSFFGTHESVPLTDALCLVEFEEEK